MELAIATPKGNKGTVEVSEAAFGIEFNQDLIHQTVVAFLAGARQGTRAQKNRSAVRLRLVSPGQNLGYFGGANAGYAARDDHLDPDITMIANPDLLFSDGFFDQLATQSALWPSDAGVIFPAVKDSATQRDSNPFLRTRPDVKYLDTRIFFFGSRLRYSVWMLLHLVKSKLRKRPQASAIEHSINPIYAGHGSLFLFLPAYFTNGASLAFESFLYAEELFVAEMCRNAGLKPFHDTALLVDHVSHITTSTLPSEQRRKWQHESLSYIRQRFF